MSARSRARVSAQVPRYMFKSLLIGFEVFQKKPTSILEIRLFSLTSEAVCLIIRILSLAWTTGLWPTV